MIRYLALLPCIASLAQAQALPPDEIRGPFAVIPHAFSISGTNTIRNKQSGDQTVLPGAFQVPTAPNVADFRIASLMAGWITRGALASDIVLDDYSIGNDLLPLTTGWILDPDSSGSDGWVAMLYSVTQATTGPGNGVITSRAVANGSAGGDLFGFYLPGANTNPATNGIPAEIVGLVLLQQGYEHIGLVSAGSELRAVDPFISLVAQGLSAADSQGLLLNNISKPLADGGDYVEAHFYFTLTTASALALSPIFNPASNRGRNLSGADVLGVTWDGTSWSDPFVFRSAEELKLLPTQDVTALAIDAVASGGAVTAFTLASNGGEVRAQRGQTSLPVRKLDGTNLRLVQTGDVDAICTYDPERAQFQRFYGTPVARTGNLARLGLALAEKEDRTGYYATMSGYGGPPVAGSFFIDVYDGVTRISVGPFPRAANQKWVTVFIPFTWPNPGMGLEARAQFIPAGQSAKHSWWVRLEN